MGETKGAMVGAAAAGQQDSLPPVIVCVTELTLILIEVDQVVGGEGQAVDVLLFQLVFVFHHPVVGTIEKACDRGQGRSRKEVGEHLFAFPFYGDLQFRHLLEEPALVRLDDWSTGDELGVAVGAYQTGDALEFLEKEGDGADADDIRLKLVQDTDEAIFLGRIVFQGRKVGR